jgi:hypothetical protein
MTFQPSQMRIPALTVANRPNEGKFTPNCPFQKWVTVTNWRTNRRADGQRRSTPLILSSGEGADHYTVLFDRFQSVSFAQTRLTAFGKCSDSNVVLFFCQSLIFVIAASGSIHLPTEKSQQPGYLPMGNLTRAI